MSWKPEVKVNSIWEQNGIVFATKEEAEANARALYLRWVLTTDSRAVESDLPVNYKWEDQKLIPVVA